MKLIKVKIENFGSIKEKIEMNIEYGITCLIGLNESGKTTILKAIKKIHSGNKIIKEEKNIHRDWYNKESEIIGIFKFEDKDVDNSIFGVKPEDELIVTINDIGANYIINHNGKDYDIDSYDETVLDSLNNIFDDIDEKNLINKDETIIEIKKSVLQSSYKSRKKELIDNKVINSFIESGNHKLFIDKINHLSNGFIWDSIISNISIELYESDDLLGDKILPEDLYSSSKISILKLAGVEIVQDEGVNKFDVGGPIEADRIEENAKIVLTNEINDVFSREDNDNFSIKIRCSDDGKSISLLTYDNTTDTSAIGLEKRSLGFRSYLTMFFTMYDYFKTKIDAMQYIVLFDEPDLHLNPSAQKDLINVFKERFEGCQIVYTTHSPYMIDTDDFKGLRIVEKTDKTYVYNNIKNYHHNPAISKNEVDLMTPVVTALGLDIAYKLTNIHDSKIILVEGIQDYYILKKMIKNINYQEKMKSFEIIPNVGASKIQYLYSYLLGLGYDLYVVFDDDAAGNKALKELKDKLVGTELEKKIMNYGVVKSNSKLEDLFDDNDKRLLDHANTYLYKKFYEEIGCEQLSEVSKQNLKKLFDYIIKV